MLTSVEVGGKWELSVEDWAEIRRLYRSERMPIKVIARVVGCSKNTVKKALAAERPPTYRRHSTGSVVAHGFKDFDHYRLRIMLAADGRRPYRNRPAHA
jgi:hypothetical protein